MIRETPFPYADGKGGEEEENNGYGRNGGTNFVPIIHYKIK